MEKGIDYTTKEENLRTRKEYLKQEFDKKFRFVGCGLCCENTWLEKKKPEEEIWAFIEKNFNPKKQGKEVWVKEH